MESIVPKCINNNTCSLICNVKICKAIPFLCANDQCSCYYQHEKCGTNIRWKFMKQSFLNKIKKSSSQLDRYFAQVNDLYRSVIKQIEKSFAQIKNISENIGLCELEREVYQKLKQKKFTELTGELINKVQTELMKDKKQYQFFIIEKEKKQIEKQTSILVKMLEGLTKLNVKQEQKISNTSTNKYHTSFKLDSKITQDVGTLLGFFPNKKIMNMNLLYRASENNFQLSKFWDKCDGKKHTIIILKTQFGNIIGGYTPLQWNKSQSISYSIDSRMQSFIFSLTNKHKLQLIKEKYKYAIQNNINYIIFGAGRDFDICDKANQKNNDARPGDTYNYNNEYIYGTQQSYKKFSGQSNGYGFKISEWQVYQIAFG